MTEERNEEQASAEVEKAPRDGDAKSSEAPVVEAPAVVEAGDVEVTVPADMLKDAMVQLKKLATLRQQEAERQRLALARMEEQMKRHSRVNRLVLLASLVVLFSLFVVSTLMRQVVSGSRGMQADLKVVNAGLGATVESVRIAARQQAEKIDATKEIVRLNAAEQAAGLQHSTAVLLESAETQQRRIGDVTESIEVARHEQKLLAKHIGETVSDMRQERDAVQAEVRTVLDEKTQEFARRELDLKDEAEKVKQQAVRAREERREIIGDAIAKLSALEGMAQAPVPAGKPARSPRSSLGAYTLKDGPIEIVGVADDASGVTFSPVTRTLFVVLNDPTRVHELGLDGKPRRVIDLKGFEDTEGIVHIGGTRFGVVEERRRNLCLFDITAATQSVDYNDVVKILIDPTPAQNKGLEGVAFEAAKKRFFIVKESGPKKIYSLPLPGAGETENPGMAWDIEKNGFGVSDLSDICADGKTGRLLILSDESRCVVDSTTEGEEFGRLSLRAGSAGLKADLVQPEGITLDDKGNLYIVCEPNQLYIFSK